MPTHEVTYCGNVSHKSGLWQIKEKAGAVLNAPLPQNVANLISFIGFSKLV